MHGEENVHQEAIHFFSNFLRVQQRNMKNYSRVVEVITAGLTVEQQIDLGKQVTPEEVIVAMFSISNKKVPGPDKYFAVFF